MLTEYSTCSERGSQGRGIENDKFFPEPDLHLNEFNGRS